MTQFTLYTVPMTRGRMARWALIEAGADYEAQVFTMASRPEDFALINPMNKVPTLVHHTSNGDQVITETAAIAHYLAQTHPEAELLPDADCSGDYWRWMFFAAGPLEQAITSKLMGWEPDGERSGMVGFGTTERTLGAIAAWLEEHDFIAGARFTMADVYVSSQLSFGMVFGALPEKALVRRYVDRMQQRPAYLEAQAMEIELAKEAVAND